MPREMMYAEAMATAITEEMTRDSDVIFYGQNLGMTDRDPIHVDYAPGVVIARVEAIVIDGGWLQGGSDGRSIAPMIQLGPELCGEVRQRAVSGR